MKLIFVGMNYLIGVTRRLIVIGEWNDGGTNAENHGWVDLAMCVRIGIAAHLQVFRHHRQHDRL